MVRSVQQEWKYIQCVTPGISHLFEPIEKSLSDKFLPAVFGNPISTKERELTANSTRNAGLGLFNPSETSDTNYASSKTATCILSNAIKQPDIQFDSASHHQTMQSNRQDRRVARQMREKGVVEDVCKSFSNRRADQIRRSIEHKTNDWLNVLPLSAHNFDLSATEFRDGLSFRYGRPFTNMPTVCDGCGEDFTVNHGLNCKKGGLIIQRHNEIRDVIGDLAALAYGDRNVLKEPIIRERMEEEAAEEGLRADLLVRGVWSPQTPTLFDVQVVNLDAESRAGHTPTQILASAEKKKQTKYQDACEFRRCDFTPLILSCDGVLGVQTKSFLKLISHKLEYKFDDQHQGIRSFIHTKVMYAAIRASSHCLRGSRIKWRSGLGLEDFSGIPTFYYPEN